MKINENIASCAGSFALRARCKWHGELRASALVARLRKVTYFFDCPVSF